MTLSTGDLLQNFPNAVSGPPNTHEVTILDDEPPPPAGDFRRGHCNPDPTFDIGDPIYMLGNLFPGMNPPNPIFCQDACDANDDGMLDIADPIRMLGALFPSGPPDPLGDPGSAVCGPDPTTDALDCVAACP